MLSQWAQHHTIQANWNAPKHILAVQSLRSGGFSCGAYESLNLGMHVGDDALTVEKNRKLLTRELALPRQPAWLNQVHGNNVVVAENLVNGDSSAPINADAIISRKPGYPCCVMTADCLPILLCNSAGTEVAAVHAGWRGLLNNVIGETVQKMQSSPESLMAWIGVGISAKNFEVGPEVKDQLLQQIPQIRDEEKNIFTPFTGPKFLLDMKKIAEIQLNTAGIQTVTTHSACTFSHAKNWFSYRRDQTTGRHATIISIE